MVGATDSSSVDLIARAQELAGLNDLHPYLLAAIIGAASLLVAWIVVLAISVVARLASRTKTTIDDTIIALSRRPVLLTVFLFGLSLATRRLELPPNATHLTVRVLATIVLLSWMIFGFRVSKLVLTNLSANRDRPIVEARTIPLFDNLVKLLLFGAASYMVLQIWHVNASAWLTSAGIIGIAIGFAAKDTLANIFSGIFILADAPYNVGDFVVLDSGDRGRVTGIGLRSPRILTRDDIEVVIPNAVIANSRIANEAGGPHPKERIRIAVSVAYGSDVDRVCEILTETAVQSDHVCRHPEPRVRFRTFGSSGLNFELLCWIDEPVLRGRVTHAVNMAVYKAFANEGIEIPYPKQDVYVREIPEAEAGKGPSSPPA